VVSDIPPFRRLTGDGAIGTLAPVGDVDAFADGIVASVDTPRAEARAAILDHFRTIALARRAWAPPGGSLRSPRRRRVAR
jgi:glycosyltransferase involved in cell wall biosynthesis